MKTNNNRDLVTDTAGTTGIDLIRGIVLVILPKPDKVRELLDLSDLDRTDQRLIEEHIESIIQDSPTGCNMLDIFTLCLWQLKTTYWVTGHLKIIDSYDNLISTNRIPVKVIRYHISLVQVIELLTESIGT